MAIACTDLIMIGRRCRRGIGVTSGIAIVLAALLTTRRRCRHHIKLYALNRREDCIRVRSMAKRYTAQFQNATDKAWYFSLFQRFPANHKLNSVAWQVAALPPQLSSSQPTYKTVTWKLDYSICLADYDEYELRYTQHQTLPAALGKHYEVSMSPEGIPSISQIPVGTAVTSAHIVLQNNANDPVNMGFIVDNSIVAVERNVGGKMKIIYPANNTFYVVCHNSTMSPGHLVDEDVAALGPIKVEYENGIYSRVIQAHKDSSENYTLQCIDSGERTEEIDSGQETYYGIVDMQINNETADDSKQQRINSQQNDCSREEVEYLQVLFVCCMMILVTALLLTITLFLCLCLVVYLFTLVCVCLIIA